MYAHVQAHTHNDIQSNTQNHANTQCSTQPTNDRQQAQEENFFLEGDRNQARMLIRVHAPVQVEIPEDSTLEQARLLLLLKGR